MAWMAWLLGQTDPLELVSLILYAGQALNVLVVLMTYAAGRVLFDNDWAGLWAAGLAGLISWFPVYYVSWGRYTHLTGVLVLPMLVVALWQLQQQPSLKRCLLAAMLGSGLCLIHIRITFFAVTLVAVLGCGLLWMGAVAQGGALVIERWSGPTMGLALVRPDD